MRAGVLISCAIVVSQVPKFGGQGIEAQKIIGNCEKDCAKHDTMGAHAGGLFGPQADFL